MGKRIEKAFGRDKGQSATQDGDDDPNKTPEPYICTGHFHTDFAELCRRNHMLTIPPVVLRPHRPPSPSAVPPAEEKGKGGKNDKKNLAPPLEPEAEPEVDENGEAIEPPPKTYVVKDKFEYFMPCVQVEMDNPDKQDTVTEIYVRGWKIDIPMMEIFKQTLVKLDRLHTINFWNTGLDEDTIDMLASFLPELGNLRYLSLDNNPVKAENWHLLIKEESPVQHLSVRYNKITDKGAELLGKALGSAQKTNTKLITLNLNGNAITDAGVEHLAGGLRMNRTLLSLCLAHNKIGDNGAKKLAEVISRFQLTHEEIVERRKLFSEKGSPERQKSPPPGSRRADSRDRPGSVRSSHAGGASKQGKSAKAKKDSKGGKEEEKTKGKKDQDKNAKKASIVADTKTQTKKGDKTKGKGKGPALPETESTIEYTPYQRTLSVTENIMTPIDKRRVSLAPSTPKAADTPEVLNPLLDQVERLDNGVIILVGNRAVLNINLAHNCIGEDGVKALLLAVGYQTTFIQFNSQNKTGAQGLMRLTLNRNPVPRDSDALQKLTSLMETKDPFYKPPAASPDQESVAQS